jgi:hypothetical protein
MKTKDWRTFSCQVSIRVRKSKQSGLLGSASKTLRAEPAWQRFANENGGKSEPTLGSDTSQHERAVVLVCLKVEQQDGTERISSKRDDSNGKDAKALATDDFLRQAGGRMNTVSMTIQNTMVRNGPAHM